MRPELLNRLADTSAELVTFEESDGHVVEGLVEIGDRRLPITRGVPCFLEGDLRPDFSEFENKHGLATDDAADDTDATDHQRTVGTFSDKWNRFKNYGFEDDHRAFLQQWYCEKLGLPDRDALKAFYSDKQTILECGPGSGFNSRFMAENSPGHVFAADISDAAYTTFENTRDLPNCHVVRADLMNLPFPDESFDFVIADGVLHHTPNTRAAVEALYAKVRPGGQFFFYVYNQMGAARRFCDSHINGEFNQLSPEECYEACEGITELGRELSNLNAKIELKKGIPVLGIPAGVHDVQRLVYYNFVKCFWNDAFDWETNNMVNYDWYHPVFAWQHTRDEITGWMNDLGVEEFAFNPSNPNGHCVLLTKPATAASAAA